MARNVLSDGDVRFAPEGFPLENVSWNEIMLERAREQTQRQRSEAPRTTPGGDPLVPADVFRELGSDAPEMSAPEPVDPRQAAADEAERVLETAREEAESTATNIKEDAKARAAMMVEKAQAEAREVLEQAKAQADAEKERLKQSAAEEGRREGREQGLNEGRENGRAEGKAEYEAAIARWQEVLAKTVSERKRALSESKALLVDLVGEALASCLRDRAASDPQMVLKFVEAAMQKAHDRMLLRVHLNPEDLAEVEKRKQELQVAVGSSRLELVPDGRVEKGGCLLETEAGSIDARLSTVVSQVKDTLSSPGA